MKSKPTRAKKRVVRRRRKAPSLREQLKKHTFPARTEARRGRGPVVNVGDLRPPHTLFWRTAAGVVIRIEDMEQGHLLNARALCRRRITKWSEIEEAMSREIRRREKALLGPFVEAVSDPMGKFHDYWTTFGQK